MKLEDMLKRLAAIDADTRGEVVEAALKATKSYKWVPNPGPQSDAYFSEADELFFGGQAGGGKALEINALVLTPFGWRKIGELKIGDSLCATDGTVQEVIGVFPQGARDLYRVTMQDGGSVLADLDHNWLAWRTHANSKKGNAVTTGTNSARKWTTRQILAEMSKGDRFDGRSRRFAIPVTHPVVFNVAGQLKGRNNFVRRPINPYLLGLIIGDGHTSAHGVSVTTADDQIIGWVQNLAGNDVAVDATSSAASTLRFRGALRAKLMADLGDLGLANSRAANKHIPRQYLFAPTAERWELLRGLMDTDGWAEARRGCYYVTISERLASDVEHLARSLGAVTTRTEKSPTYTHRGEKLRGQKAYCIRIKLADPTQAFLLDRKKEIAATIKHQSMSRIIDSIVFERTSDAVCICVSNQNSLYITEDFIVTHNSDLGIGLALNEHHRSLLLRRTNKEAHGLLQRAVEIYNSTSGVNKQTGITTPDGRLIEIGGCEHEDDKQKRKGTPHDLYVFDEVTDFTESQYVFITTWNRSAKPGQRCRVVATGNPPTTPEGLWVIKRWAAWLDPHHPNPAQPGELRWYTTAADGQEIEVDGPGPHAINGESVTARSRTFIPSALSDNPDLASTNYGAVLSSLPEDLRRAYRDGVFTAAMSDDAFQAIPTEWVKAAQARWHDHPPVNVPMCAIGVDVAQGGKDRTVLASRHDGWYTKLIAYPGKDTPDGKVVAGLVVKHRRDGAKVVVDLGGGWGGDAYGHLKENGVDCEGYMGVKGSLKRSSDQVFRFKNIRTEAYWRFREALDPSQPQGSTIALPPDNELVSDLCAPRYEVKGKLDKAVLELESKDEVCKRLGRSTDKGDAVVMAWWAGRKSANIRGGDWKPRNSRPSVAEMKRPRRA